MLQAINFQPGDIVQVLQKIKEGEKTRIQIFEGTVLGIRGREENKTFTVRKMVGQIAVEKIFPVNSLNIEDVKVKAKPKQKPRRAKLFYLRNK